MPWTEEALRKARDQKGFTVIEVFIAVVLMTFVTVGVIELFNSSTQLSAIARDTRAAQDYARTVSERIRAIPFYIPYSGTDSDIDDYFWGTAEQHGGDITSNNWSTNPLVDCNLVQSGKFTAKVKLAYLYDDLTVAPMNSAWVPEAATQDRSDEPRDPTGKKLKVLKYEVKVSWTIRVQDKSIPKSYSYVSLVTSTQYQANLGVNTMLNIDTDPTKWGTGGQNSNTAPHTKNNIKVEINGYGFKSGSTAYLVRSGSTDIALSSVTVESDYKITGYIALDSGDVGNPWSPRRTPGSWTAKVQVGMAYAYGYNAFEVQFPRPDINYLDPTRGAMSKNEMSITAGGINTLNLGGTPACGATIRLVKVDDPSAYIDPRPDRTITYSNPAPSGYDTDNRVTAVFDLTGRDTGFYYVQIINCKNNAGPPEAPGNAASLNKDAFKFEVYSSVPVPRNMYVIGSSGGEIEEATALVQMRHFAYRSRPYTYKVKVEGNDLAAVTVLKIGINGDPAAGTSPDKVITPNIYEKGDSYIKATVDFSDVDSVLARNDDVYSWWVYCAYDSGQSGYVEHIFQVRNPRAILYKDPVRVAGPADFYHNYHSITAELQGECLGNSPDGSEYYIKYRSGDCGFVNDVIYTVGVDDGGMSKGVPTLNYTRWQTQLNLIHCRNGARNIWVEKADGSTDCNKPATALDRAFTSNINVVFGPPLLNPTTADPLTTGVMATNRFEDWWGTGSPGWTSLMRGPENAAELAQRTNTEDYFYWNFIIPTWVSHEEPGYAAFTLRGQGFRDAAAGTNTINFYYSTSNLINSSTYSVYNPALADRANKYVSVKTAEWKMPNTEAQGQIKFDAGSLLNRFYIKQVLPNTDT